MKLRATLFLLAAACAVPALADDRPAVPQASAPRLGDIMGAIQLRHIKLWYAGSLRNWPLARYELDQIKDSFGDAMTYYPGIPDSDMTTMEKPVAAMSDAIAKKDRAAFERGFGDLTAACNACHVQQGYSFIVVKVPVASPFSDEFFPPKP